LDADNGGKGGFENTLQEKGGRGEEDRGYNVTLRRGDWETMRPGKTREKGTICSILLSTVC